MVNLLVSKEVISSILVQEVEKEQKPMYLVSKTLQDAEKRYETIDKITLSLVNMVREMRAYFQNHPIIVKTDYLIRKVLAKPTLAGRMIGSSVELSEFGITYEPRDPIRSQHLVDFLAKLRLEQATGDQKWIIYVDGSSNAKGSGARIILEGLRGLVIQ